MDWLGACDKLLWVPLSSGRSAVTCFLTFRKEKPSHNDKLLCWGSSASSFCEACVASTCALFLLLSSLGEIYCRATRSEKRTERCDGSESPWNCPSFESAKAVKNDPVWLQNPPHFGCRIPNSTLGNAVTFLVEEEQFKLCDKSHPLIAWKS